MKTTHDALIDMEGQAGEMKTIGLIEDRIKLMSISENKQRKKNTYTIKNILMIKCKPIIGGVLMHVT